MDMDIILKDIRLFGYHGVTELEQLSGTTFCIDLYISINIDVTNETIELSDTIDYSTVYELLKIEFAQPEQLLETLGNRISQKILNTFNLANQVEITIMKLNAPIAGLEGQVGIKLKKSR